MANRQKGEVSLEVGGTSYTFVLNMDAMIAAEELASTSSREAHWDQIIAKAVSGSAKYFRIFIWATLRKYHPDVTLEDTSALIDAAGGAVGLGRVFEAAAIASTPDPNDIKTLGVGKAKGPRRAQDTGTGGTSTSPVAGSA